MIEIYVKWCCDIEHIPYKKQNTHCLVKAYDYKTKNYSHSNIVYNTSGEQMTIFDYTLGDIAI